MEPAIGSPEFCPNPRCLYHDRDSAANHDWYSRFGFFQTRARGRIQRFRCKACGKSCSTQTFSVHYWTHSTDDLVWILHHVYGCSGLRQMGRFFGASYRLIQNRLRRLARNALAVMDEALTGLTLTEDLAMDGFQSYTRSQYHPNNITYLVGSTSQFIYAAVHTALRRSGAMTAGQKLIRALIDTVWEPPCGVQKDCTALLGSLAPPIAAAAALRTVTLSTDEHTAYPPAIAAVAALEAARASGRLIHRRVSSRAARTVCNPLFAVNYVDRQLRKNCAEHVRETIRQGREVNCQMERMAIFTVLHNFLTPHRIDGKAESAESPSHATMAGVCGERVDRQLRRLVTHRHVWSHMKSRHEWMRRIWQHAYENPPAVRFRNNRITVRWVALEAGKLPRHLRA